MNNISLYLGIDRGVKWEQYQDLLREARHYRWVKAAAQPGPKHLQAVAALLRKAMVRLTEYLPSLRPMNRARI